MHRSLNWTFRVLRGTSQGYCHRCGTIYGKRNEKCAEHIAVQKQGGTVGPGVKTPNKSSVPGSGGSVCCYGGFAGFLGPWFRNLFRFVVLFHPHQSKSKIGHGEVGWMIMKDESIPGTVVRTSSIPKELGHLVYLLGDKTGTLTQNEMVFKRLLLFTVSYGTDTMDEIQSHIIQSYALV